MRKWIERAAAVVLTVAGAVGLLVFLNVVNQLVLFAATLTATGTAGQVTDLAARPGAATLTATTPGPDP